MHLFLAETSIQLVPDGTLLAHLLIVVVMVFVVNRTLLKPINRILAEREAQIKKGITEAQSLSAIRDEKIQQYNETLHEARAEGYRLLEKERAAAMSEKEKRVREAKEMVSKRVAENIEATDSQKQQAAKQLETQAASLGAEITSHILR